MTGLHLTISTGLHLPWPRGGLQIVGSRLGNSFLKKQTRLPRCARARPSSAFEALVLLFTGLKIVVTPGLAVRRSAAAASPLETP